MIDTYKSKIPFPNEVSQVSSHTVKVLEEEEYFTDNFDYPENAMTLFYEKFAASLILKFINGVELMWCDDEFQVLIVKISIEQIVNELEFKEVVNVFEDQDGEKVVVLRK